VLKVIAFYLPMRKIYSCIEKFGSTFLKNRRRNFSLYILGFKRMLKIILWKSFGRGLTGRKKRIAEWRR